MKNAIMLERNKFDVSKVKQKYSNVNSSRTTPCTTVSESSKTRESNQDNLIKCEVNVTTKTEKEK